MPCRPEPASTRRVILRLLISIFGRNISEACNFLALLPLPPQTSFPLTDVREVVLPLLLGHDPSVFEERYDLLGPRWTRAPATKRMSTIVRPRLALVASLRSPR